MPRPLLPEVPKKFSKSARAWRYTAALAKVFRIHIAEKPNLPGDMKQIAEMHANILEVARLNLIPYFGHGSESSDLLKRFQNLMARRPTFFL